MKHGRLYVIGMILTLSSAATRGDAPKPDLQKDNAELRKEVEALKHRVDELTAKLNQNEQALKGQGLPGPTGNLYGRMPLSWLPAEPLVLPAPPPTPGRALPPGTRERMFNGAPVYVIPLEAK